jgi:ABC-type polysaccharide/polyol phosphate transport system ATPase subunit
MGSKGGEISMTDAIKVENVALQFPRGRGLFGGIKSLLGFKGLPEKNFTALETITLNVHKGEVLGVIGRNGSGKSTLLRLMAGIYQPDKGSVKVRGRTSLLAGVRVGLNEHLSGRENVHLYGSILGHKQEKMDQIMGDIIEFSELGEFFDQPLRTYSSGMRARLGIAIASAVEPEILLIDEVLGVGDPQFREKSKERILSLVKSTSTVVLVSHSFALMREICDRVAFIHEGKVHSVGDPTESIRAYYELTGKK